MGALTNYYVDPAINANSGTGTIGDPFGDLQYALNNITRDATNGDQINIKAGTAEVLAATLSFATYGTPAAGAPLIIRGYTSAAGDGGRGIIDGNAGNFSILSNVNSVIFKDMELRNTGSANIVACGAFGNGFYDCILHNTTASCIADNTSKAIQVVGCQIHDFDANGVQVLSGYFAHNYITVADAAATGIRSASGDKENVFVCYRNIISVTADGQGINIVSDKTAIVNNNSILATVAGTKRGIHIQGSVGSTCRNNLVEGFSGVGGVGILASSADVYDISRNSVFNCTTAYSLTADVYFSELNETLSATPFRKQDSNTWANRFNYFAPVDTGSVHGGAYAGRLN